MKKAILFILIFVLLTFSACGNKDELKINFGWQGTEIPSVMSAARADHSEFKTDDISLDFYFGGHVPRFSSTSDTILVGLVLYFCNSKYLYDVSNSDVEDYRNIDGLYFVRSIQEDEFNSDEYSVSQSLLTGKKFNHKERLTVPKEVIELNDGDFCLIFVPVVYLSDKNVYHFVYIDYLAIHYSFTDNQTIRLSESMLGF